MTPVISYFPMSQVARLLAEYICTAHHIEVILPTVILASPRISISHGLLNIQNNIAQRGHQGHWAKDRQGFSRSARNSDGVGRFQSFPSGAYPKHGDGWKDTIGELSRSSYPSFTRERRSQCIDISMVKHTCPSFQFLTAAQILHDLPPTQKK